MWEPPGQRKQPAPRSQSGQKDGHRGHREGKEGDGTVGFAVFPGHRGNISRGQGKSVRDRRTASTPRSHGRVQGKVMAGWVPELHQEREGDASRAH